MHIRDRLEGELFAKISSEGMEDEEGTVLPPKVISWYPNRLAWQFNYSRTQLRRLPFLEAVHEFVKRANEFGSITRQEAVSMVPPFFLGEAVEVEHVLNPC